jgi:hypothetical protein
MAQDPNTDVDRAMAALSASPTPYRNFPDMTASPAGKDQSSRRAADFPLLLSALPEVAQFPIPSAPSGRTLAPRDVESPPAAKHPPVPQHEPVEAMVARARTRAPEIPSETRTVQPRTVPQPHENTGPSAGFAAPPPANPPFRRSVSPMSPRQHATTRPLADANEPSTPLAVVFRILRSGEAHVGGRNEIQTELLNVFRHL